MNYFVSGHDVLYKKMRHSCPQATTTMLVVVQQMKRDGATLNDDDTEEIIENEGLNAFRKGHESTDDCSLRQNLQSEISGNEGQEKKRRKVVSQKEKLLVEISRGREERLKILKRMAEKTEMADSHNPVFTFLKSMVQTVTQFPPNIIAETRVKMCQLVAEMEEKAMYE